MCAFKRTTIHMEEKAVNSIDHSSSTQAVQVQKSMRAEGSKKRQEIHYFNRQNNN